MVLEQLFNKFFFAAPDTTVDAQPDLSKEDIIELLGEDDDTTMTELPPKKEEPKKEEDEEPEEELELAEEQPDEEEELEFTVPAKRKEILKKYPNIFKEFPDLQRAYYRDQQISEIFSTPKEAKAAADKAATLDRFENYLREGKTEDILKIVKNDNPESFNKLVDDYIPTLMRVDKEAGFGVISNVIHDALNSMYRKGKENQNEDLVTAATILNEEIFGTKQLQAPTKFAKPEADNKEKTQLQQEREQFQQERLNAAVETVNSKIENTIKATINQYMDPKGVMTDYVKETAVDKANLELDKLIRQDDRFVSLLDRLWQKSAEEGFSKTSQQKIKDAYISKARTLLPTVIKNHRNAALKGLGKKVTDDDNTKDKRGPIPPGRTTTTRSAATKEGTVPKGMKTLDFLNSD